MPSFSPVIVQKKSLVARVLPGCLLIFIFLTACQPGATETTPVSTIIPGASQQTTTPSPSLTRPTPTEPSSTSTFLAPDFWQSLPVVPEELSDQARSIFQQGLSLGNSPRVFSRLGDCASAAPAFLVGFYSGYSLGEFDYLQPAVDYFHESFKRPSLVAKAGLNTAAVLSTLWTDEQCLSGETLLDCQYRLDHPSFVFIALGTNDSYYVKRDPDVFEHNLRLIIDKTIALGILPILATKVDNLEEDNSINATVARLALEYELPLWNFWLAVQDLPDKGLLETEHLTTISHLNYTDLSRPHALEYGMQRRNLTALQVLYFLMQELDLEALP